MCVLDIALLIVLQTAILASAMKTSRKVFGFKQQIWNVLQLDIDDIPVYVLEYLNECDW